MTAQGLSPDSPGLQPCRPARPAGGPVWEYPFASRGAAAATSLGRATPSKAETVDRGRPRGAGIRTHSPTSLRGEDVPFCNWGYRQGSRGGSPTHRAAGALREAQTERGDTRTSRRQRFAGSGATAGDSLGPCSCPSAPPLPSRLSQAVCPCRAGPLPSSGRSDPPRSSDPQLRGCRHPGGGRAQVRPHLDRWAAGPGAGGRGQRGHSLGADALHCLKQEFSLL